MLAALLARAGHDVVVVATDATAERLNRDGLRVISAQYGDFTTPMRAVTELGEPVDLLIITTKHAGLEESLERIPADLPSAVLPMLNGVDHLAVLRDYFEPEGVLAGTIRVEATRLADGTIEQASPFCIVEVASSTASRELVDAVAAAFTRADIVTRVQDDEAWVLWSKLEMLAPMALLTGGLGQPVGIVRDNEPELLRATVAEVSRVSAAEGGPADASGVEEMFGKFAPGAKSSLLRDLEAGRVTEVDAIGGAVLRAAAVHGIPVPTVTDLVERIKRREGEAARS